MLFSALASLLLRAKIVLYELCSQFLFVNCNLKLGEGGESEEEGPDNYMLMCFWSDDRKIFRFLAVLLVSSPF